MMSLLGKDLDLKRLLDSIPETQKGTEGRALVIKAIEKAYKAGLVGYNPFDLTVFYNRRHENARRVPWLSVPEDPFILGLNATLIRSYLIENGYTNETTMSGQQKQSPERWKGILSLEWWRRLLGVGYRNREI